MGPLSGVKVLDLTSMVSGPLSTMILADQGAEVIKVEPLMGEQMRHIGPPHNGVPAGFFSCNRGKRSIALDLKTQEGKKILRELAKQADVFVQNFRPGAIERMGFSEPALRAENERLIYVSISGFGEKGPYAHKRVYDPVIQALCGATDIQADRVKGRPQMFRIIVADKVTALSAAQAISSALFARERQGVGQHIKLSMLDAMIAFFWPEAMAGLTYAEAEMDVTKLQGSMDLVYQTRDRFITAGAVSDKEWAGLCRALKREDLLEDERFKTATGRVVHAEARKKITAEEILKWESAPLLARLDAEDVPCAPLLTRPELLTHDQIEANGAVMTLDFPGFGMVRQARPAAQLEATPSEACAPAPQLGEHSREILAELGYSKENRDALLSRGIVGAAD